jgi:hypothetical protein
MRVQLYKDPKAAAVYKVICQLQSRVSELSMTEIDDIPFEDVQKQYLDLLRAGDDLRTIASILRDQLGIFLSKKMTDKKTEALIEKLPEAPEVPF